MAAPWGSKPFVYQAESASLTDVLQDFAASQAVPVAIDPQVKGRVSANFNARPEDFLRSVSKAYALVWYHDGTTLFIYPSSAMQSRLFRLTSSNGARVSQLMRSLQVGDARFPLRFNPDEQTLLAYGPPRHIEIVASVVESLEQGVRDEGTGTVRVVPLRYAVAADRRFGDNVITGMVTLLTQLYAAGANRSQDKEEAARSALGLDTIEPVAPTALERTYGTKTPGASARAAKNKSGIFVASSSQQGPAEPLSFQADEGSNAVVVRGPAERMAQVEDLIRQLDRPQSMIEIEAAIIDVGTDALESLGINWSLSSGGGTTISVAPTTPNPSLPTVTPLIEGATNITTLVADAGRRFLASVRALEGQGQARIVSRPKVLGSENRTATMVDKRIVSVRVAGNLDAKLFTIEAGTTLQVLPQIVPGDGPRQVKLSLRIQDGNFEGATVDQIPVIKRTEINTEASIREGESLLVGGISVESELKGKSGVPGLSRLPWLGRLFRVDDSSSTRRERLFLLTPKLVGSPHSISPANPVSTLPSPALALTLTTKLSAVASTSTAPSRSASTAEATAPVPMPAPAGSPAPALPLQPNAAADGRPSAPSTRERAKSPTPASSAQEVRL
jgi:type III secretion protein C